MGIHLGFSDTKTPERTDCTFPNPNPFKFKLVAHETICGKSIVLLQYPDCNTFDGLKLVLLKTTWVPTDKFDPHFLSPDHSVLARFEPTVTGWRLARMCAASEIN